MMYTSKWIFLLIPLLTTCSTNNSTLSQSCVDIIASDSFYFALPLLNSGDKYYEEMFRLENYITKTIDAEAQHIDFDCVIIVDPTEEEIAKGRIERGREFEDDFEIGSRHSKALSCLIESRWVPTVAATGQFVKLTSKHRTWDLNVQRNDFADWTFILFKTNKTPLVLPSLLVTEEKLEQYFGK